MTIFNREVLDRALRRHADAAPAIGVWLRAVEAAQWRSIVDVRRVFSSADGVEADSGAIVTIFNIRGNHYRLLTLVSYRAQVVTVVDLLTHAEYNRESWKRRL